ncbi:MAG: hypothetical protein HC800_25870 [Phormidesmis sp. RL_2_1]|nr:hypothetical protein [Phormidesmis sp. RL_2_1]
MGFLLALAIAGIENEGLIPIFMRDPASISQIHPLAGFSSNLGALLWTACAATCLFSHMVLRDSLNKGEIARFLLCSGLLTTMLLLDDFFLLHDFIYPQYLGINEKAVLLGYGGILLVWLLAFRRIILRTDYWLLLISLGFFTLSIGVDGLQSLIDALIGDLRILLEDGFKLFGIVGWLGYFMKCSLIAIRQ